MSIKINVKTHQYCFVKANISEFELPKFSLLKLHFMTIFNVHACIYYLSVTQNHRIYILIFIFLFISYLYLFIYLFIFILFSWQKLGYHLVH